MIYKVELSRIIQTINPIAFSKYLKDTNWQVLPIKRSDIGIFQKTIDDNLFQVTVPMDSSLIDYAYAMHEAVEKVAFCNNQTLEQLVLYLINPNSDVLKIRLDRKDIESGSIFFDDAINIYENAKKLITATAQDILDRRIYHKGRISDVITDFVSKCRFGQTEVGSYVVSIVCPFIEINSNSYNMLSLFSKEEECANSLTRQVTNRIMNNLNFIKTSIDNDNFDNLLSDSNGNLISVNFYEALAGMNLGVENANLNFIANWSPTVKINRSVVSKVTISHNYYEPVAEIISRIKKDISAREKICGRISNLCASPNSDERKEGIISISYLDKNDKKKTVKVTLNKDDYNNAIDAHRNGCYVEIIGDITKSGNTQKIKAYTSFNVL